MKFGSVRFFKVVILTTVLLLVLVPTVLAIVFAYLYAGQKEQARQQQAINQVLIDEFISTMELPESQFLEDLQEAMDARQELQAYQAGKVPSFAYQTLYPELYASRPDQQEIYPNTCYLTFDDGPSSVTRKILEVLDEYNIKATFFVTGKASQQNPDILADAAAAGHTIGVHTFSHDYLDIYSSVESYLADFDKMYREIQQATGQSPQVFRFAGGSVNAFNSKTYGPIVAEMTRRGFVFYDWNAAASDAVPGGIGRAEVVRNVLNSAAGQERLVILMHDSENNGATAAALPEIIEKLQEKGYTFAPITNQVEPVTYYYDGS